MPLFKAVKANGDTYYYFKLSPGEKDPGEAPIAITDEGEGKHCWDLKVTYSDGEMHSIVKPSSLRRGGRPPELPLDAESITALISARGKKSKAVLAQLCGVSVKVYSRAEQGKSISADNRERILKVLKTQRKKTLPKLP